MEPFLKRTWAQVDLDALEKSEAPLPPAQS